MTREKIREGLLSEIKYILKAGDNKTKIALAECYTDSILRWQASQGVVIAIEGELPDNKVWHKREREFEAYCAGRNDMLRAGYKLTKPLIKEVECEL